MLPNTIQWPLSSLSFLLISTFPPSSLLICLLSFFPLFLSPCIWWSIPNKPSEWARLRGPSSWEIGCCVNASEAYFYTHVCPESDVVYHSLSQRPIVQHSKKNVVIWTVSASARLSLGQLLDEIRLFPLGDCALLVPGAKLENEPRWLFLARLTSGRNLLGFNGILLLLVAFCLTPGQPKLGYCLESCMKYNRAPAICWGTFLHRVYFEERKKNILSLADNN